MSANLCDGQNSRAIGKFKVYDSVFDPLIIVAQIPLSSGIAFQSKKPGERAEISLAARKAILRFLYPGSEDVGYEFAGLQTQVILCKSRKVLLFTQPRSGLKKISASGNSCADSKGPNAAELFDSTKNFSPESALGNTPDLGPSQ